MLDKILYLLPVFLALVEIVGTIVHFVVAHRLKCEKNLLECLRDDLLPRVPRSRYMTECDAEVMLDTLKRYVEERR